MNRDALSRERLRRAFWLPSAVAMLVAVPLAYGLRALDASFDLGVGLFAFNDLGSARSLLSTIASATVSVAGLSFSVTLVALQLSSSQLSPRVLTTFREDRVAQATLAAFLGVFAYAVTLLGRLTGDDRQVPEVSMLVAILGALGAFGLFVAFIGRVIAGLQASTVIQRTATDAERALDTRHPERIGSPAVPGDDQRLARWRAEGRHVELRARSSGFLLELDGDDLLGAARRHDAVVVQRAQVGDLVVRSQLVADAFVLGAWAEGASAELEAAFRYGEERTLAADVAFSIRSLADVALRALSPSLNDPTTAENAMGGLVGILMRLVEQEEPEPLRCDLEGTPRFLALTPNLDDLVLLGFEQVRAMVVEQDQRLVAGRLVAWLAELDRAAAEAGLPRRAIHHELDGLRATADSARE